MYDDTEYIIMDSLNEVFFGDVNMNGDVTRYFREGSFASQSIFWGDNGFVNRTSANCAGVEVRLPSDATATVSVEYAVLHLE